MKIYKIVNTLNGKIYVGKTSKTIEERFNRHCKSARKKINRHLYDAMNCYGIDNFEVSLIEIVSTNDEANIRERFWIKNLNTKTPNGYNMTDGGDGGYTLESWSKESLHVLYKTQADKRRGKRSKEFCETMSRAAKLREALKTSEQKVNIGRKISETNKRKGIKPPQTSLHGADNWNYTHIDIDICLSLIKRGLTLKQISKHFNTSSQTIWSKLKSTGKTFTQWKLHYGTQLSPESK